MRLSSTSYDYPNNYYNHSVSPLFTVLRFVFVSYYHIRWNNNFNIFYIYTFRCPENERRQRMVFLNLEQKEQKTFLFLYSSLDSVKNGSINLFTI
ncbi:unnamed protein product [Pieris brassicae]|uniref:Uncharacterized protein n=1 Tax=Pieris brassicae TaxID=7116 RepID=A0A9P0U3A5_PIEBR|nr:unnamed protein product [Pieris brassicae]